MAALIGVAVASLWPKSARTSLRLPTASLALQTPSPRARRIERSRQILGAMVVLCLALAVAGVRGFAATIEDRTEGISLALVVDVSGSMATPDFPADGKTVTRWDGVRDVFRLLVAGGETSDGVVLPGRPNDLIALIPFATRPETACPPTLDHAALLTILDRLTPKTLVSEATTNPGDALALAIAVLDRAPTRRKAIVFLTDGESNVPPPALSPRQAGQLAANLDIPIYTIDALSDAEVGPDAPKAHQTLIDLAAMTGGRSFRAEDAASLRLAIQSLDRIERDAIARPPTRQYVDLSMPIALVAFLAWIALGLVAPPGGGAP